MTDNVTTDPGTGGADFRTTEIAGVHHPHSKMEFGGADEAIPVTKDTPLPMEGANIEALLVELAFRLSDIADSVGNLMPDVAGRLRVAAETVANITTVTTVTNVTNLGTLATLTNQTQIGGYSAVQQILALTQMNETQLRNNVVIS